MAQASKEEVVLYLDTALWNERDENDVALEANYSVWDFSAAAHRQARAELESFWSDAVRVIDTLRNAGQSADIDLERWPYHFWLNRNRDGTGFWDHEELYGAAAEPLSELAKMAGARNVLETDDGELEFFPPMRVG